MSDCIVLFDLEWDPNRYNQFESESAQSNSDEGILQIPHTLGLEPHHLIIFYVITSWKEVVLQFSRVIGVFYNHNWLGWLPLVRLIVIAELYRKTNKQTLIHWFISFSVFLRYFQFTNQGFYRGALKIRMPCLRIKSSSHIKKIQKKRVFWV